MKLSDFRYHYFHRPKDPTSRQITPTVDPLQSPTGHHINSGIFRFGAPTGIPPDVFLQREGVPQLLVTSLHTEFVHYQSIQAILSLYCLASCMEYIFIIFYQVNAPVHPLNSQNTPLFRSPIHGFFTVTRPDKMKLGTFENFSTASSKNSGLSEISTKRALKGHTISNIFLSYILSEWFLDLMAADWKIF